MMKRAVLLSLLAIAGCATRTRSLQPPSTLPSTTSSEMTSTTTAVSTTTTTWTTTSTTSTAPYEHWTGPVEHLFFHTLVIRPELAFADPGGQGFRDYFVTVGEFKKIMEQLYANGWTLVDIHRVVAGQVEVPRGRKPLVLSEDDVNYYSYETGRGLGTRLLVDPLGNVKVEETSDHGTSVTDNDLIPLVDEFVTTHPLFSADGAKGVVALTGYEGVFGERTNELSNPDSADRVARARVVADRLKATGWTLASHSYGHIDLKKDSAAIAQRDTDRWVSEVQPITGPTDVYIFPFGAAPATSSPTVQMLRAKGFTIFCDIDIVARLKQADGVALMSRRHIDGIAFANPKKALTPFFDVDTVQDVAARRVATTTATR